jgi:hypothetical protein
MQSLQVPSAADQSPLTADRFHPAQQELAKSHDGIDDSEHRFGGMFSLGVKSSTFFFSFGKRKSVATQKLTN